MSGQNRSATVVLGILLRSQSYRLDEARRMIQKKRPVVQINKQYAKQLAEMEREIFGRISVPNNWMSIKSIDMETGDIAFGGDTAHNRDSEMSTDSNEMIPIKRNLYTTVKYID